MTFSQFAAFVDEHPQPVVLLEGTRALPDADAPQLELFAANLAKRFPNAKFRSGNAPGSDDAWSRGIAFVDASRLEIIVPYAKHRLKERPTGARVLSLDSVEDYEELARLTLAASPGYTFLSSNQTSTAKAKFSYLLRDTLKITGDTNADFAPANLGVFFVDEARATTGGTAHTMRVCEANGVATVVQAVWRSWEFNS